MSQSKDLRNINRFVTSHTDEGKTIFSSTIAPEAPFKALPDGAEFALCYATNRFPVQMQDDTDISTYKNFMTDLPGITISTGSILRVVDMMPGALSPMHRTVSLDYGVVLEGEVELILDSGENRLMKRGDISVQRGTNHAWKNTSDTKWARMLYVLLGSEPLVIGGQTLEEDTSTIPGVKASKKCAFNRAIHLGMWAPDPTFPSNLTIRRARARYSYSHNLKTVVAKPKVLYTEDFG